MTRVFRVKIPEVWEREWLIAVQDYGNLTPKEIKEQILIKLQARRGNPNFKHVQSFKLKSRPKPSEYTISEVKDKKILASAANGSLGNSYLYVV